MTSDEIETQQPETLDQLIDELERLRDEHGGGTSVEAELSSRVYLVWLDDHLEIW